MGILKNITGNSFVCDNTACIFCNTPTSKGEAKKMLQNGGISINKEKVIALDMKLTVEHLLNDRYILVQKGKSNYTLAIFS